MIKRTIPLPLYHTRVHVLMDGDINPHYHRLCKRLGIAVDPDATVYGCVLADGDYSRYHILFSTNELSLKWLTHEITHLGATILADRGHQISGDSEPLAYLNGYLAEELEKIMIRNGIELIKPKLKHAKIPQKASSDRGGATPAG